jgi:glycosyltransferase involved in cell wall biosynthesis
VAEPTADLRGVRVVVLNWRDRDHPLAGGAEEYAHRMADSLHEAGARVTFLAAAVRGRPGRREHRGITTLRRGTRWTVYLWALGWLLRHRREVDVVVDCQNGIPFFSPLVLRRGTPVVLVMHHVHDAQFGAHFPGWLAKIGRWLEGPAASRVYRRAVAVAVSPSTVRAMRTRLRWHGPVFVVPNGMADRPARVRPRATEPILVCLGRLVVHKRVDRLIDTVAALRARWPTLELHVIGRGPDEQALRARAAACGGAVVVHGFLDEGRKAELLARSWLNVTLSDGEGWGLAVLEAAAHGVPTLCRDVDGLRDSVRHGRTGWLVGDGEDVADAIDAALRGLSAADAAATIARACRDWAAEFDWAESGRRFGRLVADQRRGQICPEWTVEGLVAEFAWPAEFDADRLARHLGTRTAVVPRDSRGWLLAEQCRPGEIMSALADAGATEIRVRPAEDIERLLGRPWLRRAAYGARVTVG